MMRQYQAIKEQHPDSILFFRLGDFYEMFLEDAKVASKILDLTLTGRGKNENRVPMCGVPFHARENYINKLVKHGYKVAICEQTEEATPGKGLTERAVIQTITPGTILQDNALEASTNNFLMAIQEQKKGIAIAVIDYSTGDFLLGTLNTSNELETYLTQCQIKEVLIDENSQIKLPTPLLKNRIYMHNLSTATQKLQQYFQVKDMDGFGLKHDSHCFSAAYALIDYLQKTQQIENIPLKPCKRIPFSECLQLDQHSSKHLELFKDTHDNSQNSLFHILNHCKTPMGKRKLTYLLRHPLQDIPTLEKRLDQVESMVQSPLFKEGIRQLLTPINDIERISNKIWTKQNNPKDLAALKETIKAILDLSQCLERYDIPNLKRFNDYFNGPDKQLLTKVQNEIEKALIPDPPSHLRDGNIINSQYSNELEALLNQFKEIRTWINKLEEEEKEKTGIKTLKVGFNKVFGYYIEVSKLQQSLVPDTYIRKQTLTNAERYITAELKEKEQILLQGDQQQIQLEQHLYSELLKKLHPFLPCLQRAADWIAKLDVIQSLGHVSQQNNYCRPSFHTESGTLYLEDNRHPILETHTKTRIIPNTISLTADSNLMLITGPNMAGKSTIMRQVALSVIMAQIGCFVPAKTARLSITKHIFTRIGASDDLYRGQSTFMVEMVETANILNNACKDSLIILDEIGRGTATYDGLSIAAAVIKHLQTHITTSTLFATHYHELTPYCKQLTGIQHQRMGIIKSNNTLQFTYLLEKGSADSSYGLTVAKMAGIPDAVLADAQALLKGLEDKGLSHITHEKKPRHPDKKEGKNPQLLLWQQ
ncbi:MAG: DNA mismatch repair protein MutS [bacterium]